MCHQGHWVGLAIMYIVDDTEGVKGTGLGLHQLNKEIDSPKDMTARRIGSRREQYSIGYRSEVAWQLRSS